MTGGNPSHDLETGKEAPRSTFETLYKSRGIDSYRKGYPQASLIIGETPEFLTFRRFRRSRARLLLSKQDHVVKMEGKLDEIDANEQKELFLGNMRRDKNQERQSAIDNLDKALADYDQLLQRCEWACNLPYPTEDSMTSMRDWRDREGSMARVETAYLDFHRWELVNIGDRNHLTYTRLELQLRKSLEWLLNLKYRMFKLANASEFGPVLVYRPLVREGSRVFIAVFAVLLLLAPIVGLNDVQRTLPKFAIIFSAATVFILFVSILSKANMGEVFAAGAAYAAVMVVFVSGNGVQSS